MAQSALLLIGMVLLSRVTGFFRGSLLAYYFGQNRMTDAYAYAFTVPDALWMLVAGGAMYAAFVPVISEYFAKGDEEGAWKTFSVVFTFLSLLLLVVITLMEVYAAPLLHFFARDLQRPGQADIAIIVLHGKLKVVHPFALAVHLTRIIIPAQICFFLGSLMMGCQQSLKRFMAPALGPVIYNVGLILGGVLLHGIGIDGFAWGALAGAFIGNLLIQAWALSRLRPRFRLSLDLGFPGVRKCGVLVLPVLLGVSLPQVDTIINGYFVSGLPAGRSILDYTNRLMQLPLGIFGQAIGMVILPTLSEQSAQKDMKAFRDTLSLGIRLALFLTVPASVLMIVLARPLLHVVYQHGAFTAADTTRAIPTLVYYVLGVAAWSVQAIAARGFYALQLPRVPVILGTVITGAFIILNGFLVHLMGVKGAALATTIAASAHTLILLGLLSRRVRGLGGRQLSRSCRRIVFCSTLMGLAAWGCHTVLPAHFRETLTGSVTDLLLSGFVGVYVYLRVQWRSSEELRRFLEMIKAPALIERMRGLPGRVFRGSRKSGR